MSGWLKSATNVFRRKSNAPPQPYAIICGCGERLKGERIQSEQSVTCPACQATLFVLPASVYPLLRPPVPKIVARSSSAKGGAGLTDADSRGMHIASAAGGRTQVGSRTSVGNGQSAPANPERTFHDRLRQAFEPDSLHRLRRKLFTPVRIVLIGVACVVAMTVWWIGHMRALDRARVTLATVPRLAETALEEGDAPEAARQFALIRKSVDLLGRDDSQSRQWRQLARETAVISDLASAPLHEILNQAAESAVKGEAGAWSSTFRASFHDGWVLIDAPVSRNSDTSSGSRYTVDFPLAVADTHGKLVADLKVLEPALAGAESPRRVIFAAQLADCRLDTDPANSEPVWRIELRPETGFLWSGTETFRMLGMPVDEESLGVLAAQSKLLGIEP